MKRGAAGFVLIAVLAAVVSHTQSDRIVSWLLAVFPEPAWVRLTVENHSPHELHLLDLAFPGLMPRPSLSEHRTIVREARPDGPGHFVLEGEFLGEEQVSSITWSMLGKRQTATFELTGQRGGTCDATLRIASDQVLFVPCHRWQPSYRGWLH